MKCDICGKDKKTVVTVPSGCQLLFGGFPVTYARRCQACETKLAKSLLRMIK